MLLLMPEGPLSGVRFEAQRIGMEDGELLRVLKSRDPDKAAAIIDRVFRAFDDYAKDVGAYRAAKRDLLKALTPVTTRPAEGSGHAASQPAGKP